MNIELVSRRLFVPDRWVVAGFIGGNGKIFTPQIFRGTQRNGCYHSYAEAMAAVRDAFETPGVLDDTFVRATKGWTFQAMRIDDGYTNGLLRAQEAV